MNKEETIANLADQIMEESLKACEHGLDSRAFDFARKAVIRALHQSTNIWGDMYIRAKTAERQLDDLRKERSTQPVPGAKGPRP